MMLLQKGAWMEGTITTWKAIGTGAITGMVNIIFITGAYLRMRTLKRR